jgi:hypothetical protein
MLRFQFKIGMSMHIMKRCSRQGGSRLEEGLSLWLAGRFDVNSNQEREQPRR